MKPEQLKRLEHFDLSITVIIFLLLGYLFSMAYEKARTYALPNQSFRISLLSENAFVCIIKLSNLKLIKELVNFFNFY